MNDKDALTVRDCLEAYTFYSGVASQILLSKGRRESFMPSQRALDVMAEAYLMRAESLTNINT